MPPVPSFHPAYRHSLQQLAAFFTAAFEGYAFPVITDAEQLAKRVREEALDLSTSHVAALGGYPIGLFLLARRGSEAWCGGFGINKPQRGNGYAQALADDMIESARRSGAKRFRLEVLRGNKPALACYERAGFAIERELLLLSWKPDASDGAAPEQSLAVSSDPSSLLESLQPVRNPRACWQRSTASLLARNDLEVFRLPGEKAADAVVLGTRRADGTLRIYDFGGAAPSCLSPLLAALQGAFPKGITLYNEPADSPYLPLVRSAGFQEVERQYELTLDLSPKN